MIEKRLKSFSFLYLAASNSFWPSRLFFFLQYFLFLVYFFVLLIIQLVYEEEKYKKRRLFENNILSHHLNKVCNSQLQEEEEERRQLTIIMKNSHQEIFSHVSILKISHAKKKERKYKKVFQLLANFIIKCVASLSKERASQCSTQQLCMTKAYVNISLYCVEINTSVAALNFFSSYSVITLTYRR